MVSDWEVVPGRSIGPVTLGMSSQEVIDSIGPPDSHRDVENYRTLQYEQVRVILINGEVEILSAELKSGAVVRSTSIRVGMPYLELLATLKTQLVFDEEQDSWVTDELPGVFIEIVRPGNPAIDSVEFVSQPFGVSEPEASIVGSLLVQ